MIAHFCRREKIHQPGFSENASLLFGRELVSAPMLAAVFFLALGLPSGGLADHATDAASKWEHLLQAATHLEKAGRTDLAAEIYAQLAAAPEADRQRLIDAKREQIRQLEADAARLRTSPAAGDQVLVQLKVIELSLEKLRASGLSLVSIRNLLDSQSASAVLDEDGQISRFMELLSREGLVQVVAEPKLVTVDGRSATLQVGHLAASDPGAAQHRTGQPDGKSAGLRFTCTPRIVDSGKLSLDLHFLRQMPPDTAKQGEPARDPQVVGSQEVSTEVDLRSGETLVLAGPRRSAGVAGNNTALLLVTATILGRQAP